MDPLSIFINILGFTLIFAAVNFKRTETDEIKGLSRDWFIILIMITVGYAMTLVK